MVSKFTTAVVLSFVFGAAQAGSAGATVILTYHDMVSRRDSQALWFDCTPQELTQQLDWLSARGGRFVSLDQVLDRRLAQAGGNTRVGRKEVAITFADNYEGFWLRAWPILRRRRIPVALFVHTGYVGDRHGRPKMTWDQLKVLDRSGLVTICSQTVSHPADLRDLNLAQVRREMVDSKASLEMHLGHRVRYVAYPNGKFDRRSEEAAKAAGYVMGFSENQVTVEASPSIYAVARYVHTRYRKAWRDMSR